jgi:hypothetical protein
MKKLSWLQKYCLRQAFGVKIGEKLIKQIENGNLADIPDTIAEWRNQK